jgi:2-hydroxy-3-oxopropionate reductase
MMSWIQLPNHKLFNLKLKGRVLMASKCIGFIGLGIMGGPMAENLIKAGYEVIAFNRTREKADRLEKMGARIVESPAQVAKECSVVVTIVTDSPDVEEVVCGPEGIIHTVRPGTIVVDMSTIAPATEKRLYGELSKKDATLVDAPVSGGDVGAVNGTLAIMAGGDREAFDEVKPVFEAMGKSITYCGPVGSGQLTKLCNQILVSVTLLGVSEAIAFALKNGLDPAVMVEAVKGGAAGSWQLSNLGPKIIQGDFDPGFMVDLMQKDLRLVLEAADRARASLPATSLVHQLFNAAQARDRGKDGTQALSRTVAELSSI